MEEHPCVHLLLPCPTCAPEPPWLWPIAHGSAGTASPAHPTPREQACMQERGCLHPSRGKGLALLRHQQCHLMRAAVVHIIHHLLGPFGMKSCLHQDRDSLWRTWSVGQLISSCLITLTTGRSPRGIFLRQVHSVSPVKRCGSLVPCPKSLAENEALYF